MAFLCAILLAGCADKKNNEPSPAENGVTLSGDTLRVDSTSPLIGKIEIDSVAAHDYDLALSTTGVVTAIPSTYAEVAAPFGGRIVKSLVKIGQQVKAGAPLFEISSTSYSEIVKNYYQAKSELELARKAHNRVSDLHQNRVASEKELDESQEAVNLALQEYNHALAAAKEYQIDLKGAAEGQPMIVRSPISGKVLRNDLVIGEYVREDADAKVVVADLSKVWVKANVSEMESPYVRGVADVEVRLASRPDSVIMGRVAYTDGMLDAETRTLQTFVECDNRSGVMMPNMYANVRISLKGQQHILIPKDAALQSSKGRYVLRRVADNTYVKTPIEAQSIDNDQLIVLNGLAVGDVIVTKGAFYFIDCK